MAIDRSSPIPLYFQLKQILVRKIDADEWAQGALIPSEFELQEAYGLSRTTVRQTLAELVNEGRLTRHRGKGTFVSAPKIAHNPTSRLDISEQLRHQGLKPVWKVLESSWVEAPPEVCAALELAAAEPVFRVSLLLQADSQPIARHNSYLPLVSVGDIDRPEVPHTSVLDHIRDLPKRFKCRSTRTFEAICAGEDEAELLKMSAGDPLLSIQIQFTSEDGVPVELLQAVFRGDRFKYQISL